MHVCALPHFSPFFILQQHFSGFGSNCLMHDSVFLLNSSFGQFTDKLLKIEMPRYFRQILSLLYLGQVSLPLGYTLFFTLFSLCIPEIQFSYRFTVPSQAGLSMALGAFLAGLLLAETEFSLQVESDIAPYRGLLLGLFFMTVRAL
jgi:hypothetical protein